MHKGIKIDMTADFSLETMQARRQQSNILNALKGQKETLKTLNL
jgi:hypothetical protein